MPVVPHLKPNQLEEMHARAAQAADMMRALSHPTRLMVLCHLAGAERNVNDLCAALDMPQAQMSQQLARLRQDGLVVSRKDGRTVYYKVATASTEQLILTLHDLYCSPANLG